MTERLATLLREESETIAVPRPVPAEILSRGRSLRARRRWTRVGLALCVALLARARTGSGTSDEYIRAFHSTEGLGRLEVVPVRLLAAMATLGGGAPLGYEGPALYAGAGIGELVQRRAGRFAPRDAKVWTVRLTSNFPPLDGLSGKFTPIPPPLDRTRRPSPTHPNWWTDDPAPAAAEGIHAGAKHVNRWRDAFLRDFAERLSWAKTPSTRDRK